MPPFWKIVRELKRFVTQALEFPRDMISRLFGARYYDLFLSQRQNVTLGTQERSDFRVVYVIFPVNGLLPTHIQTLEYLNTKGQCVTVVSNAPLSTEDTGVISKLCYRYIERPNFGYDFGGYRSGILSFEKDLSTTKRLVLLNDSVWFPICDKTDWFESIEALNVDFAGAVSNFGIPRVDPAMFRDLNFDYRTDHKNFHYCSFALSFSGNILGHPDFLLFWKRFPLTNRKKRTVRRGEIGLTTWVLKYGFSHGETFGVANLRQYLETLDKNQLLHVVAQIIIPEDERLRLVKRELLPYLHELTRDELVKFVLTAVARQGAGYALAHFAILERGYPFMKKSPLWLDREASDISMRVLKKIGTPVAREALEEAKRLRAPILSNLR